METKQKIEGITEKINLLIENFKKSDYPFETKEEFRPYFYLRDRHDKKPKVPADDYDMDNHLFMIINTINLDILCIWRILQFCILWLFNWYYLFDM